MNDLPTGAANAAPDPLGTYIVTAGCCEPAPGPKRTCRSRHRWRGNATSWLATFSETVWPVGPDRRDAVAADRPRLRELDDRSLVAKAKRYLDARRLGEPTSRELTKAWDKFYAHCDPLVRGIARRCARSAAEAEDLGQEAWAELARTLASLPADLTDEGVRNWAAVVAYRKAREARQRWSRGPSTGEGAALCAVACDRTSGPVRSAEQHELRRAVQQVLARLDDRSSGADRDVLRLYGLEGHSSVEVAERLGMSPEQVRTRNRRLKPRLRHALRAFDAPVE